MLANSMVAAIAVGFGLGNVEGEIRQLTGGRAHETWKLDTDRGAYVVKVLRWRDSAAWRERYEAAIALELAAQRAGVASPQLVAVPTSGPVLELAEGDKTRHVRVHHFVEGAHPGWGPANEQLARWVGRTLATIHDLAQTRPARPDRAAPAPSELAWAELVARGREAEAVWCSDLERAMPTIAAIERAITRGPNDGGEVLWTHGEIDERNVLMGNDGPVLIDWDGLWSFSREVELTSVVLHWCGASIADPDPTAAHRILESYLEAGVHLRPFDPSFMAIWLAYQLGWLFYAGHLSLGDPIPALDSHAEPPDETVFRCLGHLPRLLVAQEEWIGLFEPWLGSVRA